MTQVHTYLASPHYDKGRESCTMQWKYRTKCDSAHENIKESIIMEVTFELDIIRTKVRIYFLKHCVL